MATTGNITEVTDNLHFTHKDVYICPGIWDHHIFIAQLDSSIDYHRALAKKIGLLLLSKNVQYTNKCRKCAENAPKRGLECFAHDG